MFGDGGNVRREPQPAPESGSIPQASASDMVRPHASGSSLRRSFADDLAFCFAATRRTYYRPVVLSREGTPVEWTPVRPLTARAPQDTVSPILSRMRSAQRNGRWPSRLITSPSWAGSSALIETLHDAPEGLHLHALAEKTGYVKGSVHRTLSSLAVDV